jgi:hypothetical protein
MFTQAFINFSNTKSYGNRSVFELFHADRLSYVPRGWECACNRCVSSAFASSRVISRWSGSKNWNLSFPHYSLKMVHGPLFFSHPIRQLTLYQINKDHAKLRFNVFMAVLMVRGAFPVTAPCRLARSHQTFGGTQCLYVQGSKGCVWPYL